MTADATRLAEAFRGRGPVRALETPPRTVAEAYDLQDAVRETLGAPIVGWKLAYTARAARRAFRFEAPTVAPLLQGMIVPGETVFPAGAFFAPTVEAEIVLELGTPLEGPRRKEEVIAALRGMRIGIEIGDSRFVDPDATGPLDYIADMCGGAALVIGPLMDLDGLHAAQTVTPTVRLGDGTMAEPMPPDMRPNPIEMLTFLLRFLAERGKGLAAGTLVTTGAHSVTTRSAPGQVAIRFGDTMRLSARLSQPRHV